MAPSTEYLVDLLNKVGGPTPEGVKKMLIFADTLSEFATDEAWAALCEFVMAVDEDYAVTAEYIDRFQRGGSPTSAMADNYVLAAMAANKLDWEVAEPLMAYAATNKHEFQGFAPTGLSEISCMRILHWGEWRINDPLPGTKLTALHLLAYLKYTPGSHPRAVRWLLEHGADANAKTIRGDTPLMMLAGCDSWTPEMTQSFKLLLAAGANPLEQAEDGNSALSLLTQVQKHQANSARADLLSALEKDIHRANGFFTKMLDLKPVDKWASTLKVNHSTLVMQMTP